MDIKLDDHLCFKLYVASRLIIQGYARDLAPLGLTYQHYLVLLALGEKDGQSVRSLGESMSLDSGTLSPVLKSLAKNGYIRRSRRKDDERVVCNFLTAEGRKARTKAMGVAYQLFCETKIPIDEFTKLRSDIDQYVTRCKSILNEKSSRLVKAKKSSPKISREEFRL